MNILIIVAHPDDEILGCGGTIARHKREGDNVSVLYLGGGRSNKDEEIAKALKILDIPGAHFYRETEDQKFDAIPFLNIVQFIEYVIDRTQPNTIYTHSAKDLNLDHQIVHKAVKTATRLSVDEIYAFETLSSTEWNYNHSFAPNYFVDIGKDMGTKLRAMKAYKSEIRDEPHPRSLDIIESLAKLRGSTIGVKYAEAFEVVRIYR